jgi:uncharacterized protein YndB with AHSA1/START domain
MSTTTLVITQHVPAAPERVWAAWTEPQRLASWWWPMFADTAYALDVRPGGEYRIASASAGFGVHGTVVAVEEPRRLELTWVWEDAGTHGPEEQVVVEIAADGDGTLVTVRHATEAAGAADFRQGWTDCLGRLGQKPPA